MIYFFFQAEDGIRDGTVTGVQTCALPISLGLRRDDPDLEQVVLRLRRQHEDPLAGREVAVDDPQDRKSTRLNSSHSSISYAVFCMKKKKKRTKQQPD